MGILRKFIFPPWLYWVACCALLAAPAASLAQTPNAGSLLQQMEQSRPQPVPAPPAPVPHLAPPEMKPTPGLSVVVRAFRFSGNHLLSDERLKPAVLGYLNHPLTFPELQQAAAAVAQVYRQEGWVVRAYLPRQEIIDGVVTIQIVEAVFGGIQLDGPAPSRLPIEQILALVNSAQPIGSPVNGEALDRALLLLDDLPGINVSGNLKSGPREGETSLMLKLEDKSLASGDLAADNTGSRSTGPARLLGTLFLNSPAHRGDQLAATAIHTEGSDYARLGYTLPMGSQGWRMGANASWLNYRLIAPEFSALDAHGSSTTVGLEASYPLVRSRLNNLQLLLNLDRKYFDNQASGSITSHYTIQTMSLGLNGNLFDGLGGTNNGNLTVTSGSVDLNGSPSQEADTATTRSAGHFSKLRYALSRQQFIRPDLAAYGTLSGQMASKNLDSAEKFYLGGSAGVRAYPASEGGGSDGMLVSLELRKGLKENFVLTGFYDWGKVTINHDNDFAGAATLNRFSLRGVGFCLGWLPAPGMSLKATWARRIGDNPNPTSSGQDQDGSLIRNRYWLQASLAI